MADQPTAEAESRLLLREYQMQLIQIALAQNTIIFLPTGAGKTHIAIEVLLRRGDALTGPNGKRAVFLAPTKALVIQIYDVLRRRVPYKVAFYTGDQNVDIWQENKWINEFKNYEVFVMTPKILEDLLTRVYVKISLFDLIVVDECHSAVKDFPSRMIMKELEKCSSSEQPRIIGLSATLLNKTLNINQVEEELSALERTFHGTIATCNELQEVLKYSSKPQEIIESYYEEVCSNEKVEELCANAKTKLNKMKKMYTDGKKRSAPLHLTPEISRNIPPLCVSRSIDDLLEQYSLMGHYPGAAAALYHTISSERSTMLAKSDAEMAVFSYQSFLFYQIRRTLIEDMGYDQTPQNIFNYLNEKTKKLIEVITDWAKLCKETNEEMSCIVFVERRTTSIILYYILKKLAEENFKDLEHVRPAFLCGAKGNPKIQSAWCALQQKWQEAFVKKFQTGEVNVLIATSILEEGIDVRLCNLVVVFDTMKLTYRSYVQAKGRARSERSKHVLLVAEGPKKVKLEKQIKDYTQIQEKLHELLIGRNEEREPPSLADIQNDLYVNEIAPYYVGGPESAHANGINAIRIVASYCAKLPQDIYTQLAPTIYYKHTKIDGTKYSQAFIELPIQSPLRSRIAGEMMRTMRSAKRSAFVKVVKHLHEQGELNDQFAYRGREVPEFDDSRLFPNYIEESFASSHIPGTKKKRRLYDVEFPKCLTDSRPRPDGVIYMHVLIFEPEYIERLSEKKKECSKLLSTSSTIALITSKRFPSICPFPLYMSLGKVMCSVKQNAQEIMLGVEQLKLIADFQYDIFSHMLALVKDFQIFDCAGGRANDYFIVPVFMENNRYEINWRVVLNTPKYLAVEKCRIHFGDTICKSKFLHLVVSPHYRYPETFYIVTKVEDSMNPRSSFPDTPNITFESYYANKYTISIEDLNQPLLEVQRMPSILQNFIRPRVISLGGIQSSRKKQEKNDDLNEHLVPELCDYYGFPSNLWMKCVLLPTALYRITNLLLVTEFHFELARDTGLGLCNNEDSTWQPLECDANWVNSDSTPSASVYISPNHSSKSTRNSAKVHNEWLSPNYEEPINLWLNMDKIATCDLQHHVEFVNKAQRILDLNNERLASDSIDSIEIEQCVHVIKILQNKTISNGKVELAKLLSVVTTKGANDIVNLERLETLGDSFLKFAASIFVFREFPDFNEGQLVLIKSRMVSNRNLYGCGVKRKLQSLIQVDQFDAYGDWVPPNFKIPDEVFLYAGEERLRSDPNLLQKILIPHDEIKSGILSSKTCEDIGLRVFHRNEAMEPPLISDVMHSTYYSLLSKKVISDKTIADSCEALLGAYLEAFGVEGGFRILNWLNVLPKNGSYTTLIAQEAPSPVLLPNRTNEVEMQLSKLRCLNVEKILGYSFKNKGYLLQALTHPTFPFHRLTDCYQRLEFLGDAVLDVLVTMYIYEECPKMSPGEITLLRTALVNNTTFACLSVRYEFYKYLLYQCPPLSSAMENFVQYQEEHNHVINDAVLILLEEVDCSIAESVDVPKVLGDVFESIAGAIFLDSGNSLEAVWRVYYKLLRPVIDEFSSNIPKNLVMKLHESVKKLSCQVFKERDDLLRVKLEFTDSEGELHEVYGFGRSKFEAKRSAAKIALRKLQK